MSFLPPLSKSPSRGEKDCIVLSNVVFFRLFFEFTWCKNEWNHFSNKNKKKFYKIFALISRFACKMFHMSDEKLLLIFLSFSLHIFQLMMTGKMNAFSHVENIIQLEMKNTSQNGV